jgi:hypothetical protein
LRRLLESNADATFNLEVSQEDLEVVVILDDETAFLPAYIFSGVGAWIGAAPANAHTHVKLRKQPSYRRSGSAARSAAFSDGVR